MKNKENVDYQNGYVQICVGCCQLNSQNRKTLPLKCPKTNMPCFAIKPEYLIPKPSEEMVAYLASYNGGSREIRLPLDCKYIDESFVRTRCEAFQDLAKKGNKTIYTMEAY